MKRKNLMKNWWNKWKGLNLWWKLVILLSFLSIFKYTYNPLISLIYPNPQTIHLTQGKFFAIGILMIAIFIFILKKINDGIKNQNRNIKRNWKTLNLWEKTLIISIFILNFYLLIPLSDIISLLNFFWELFNPALEIVISIIIIILIKFLLEYLTIKKKIKLPIYKKWGKISALIRGGVYGFLIALFGFLIGHLLAPVQITIILFLKKLILTICVLMILGSIFHYLYTFVMKLIKEENFWIKVLIKSFYISLIILFLPGIFEITVSGDGSLLAWTIFLLGPFLLLFMFPVVFITVFIYEILRTQLLKRK